MSQRGGRRGAHGGWGGSGGGGASWRPPGQGGNQGYQGHGGGGDRRDQGYQRGGGGGRYPPRGGGFGSPNIQIESTNLPNPVTTQMLLLAPLGWSESEGDKLQPPPSSEPGTIKDREIGLIINHVPSKITPPETIYQYEISVDLADDSKRAKQERKKKPPQDPKNAKKGEGQGPAGAGDADSDYAPRSRLWKKIVKHIIPFLERWHDDCSTSDPHASIPSTGAAATGQAPRAGGSNMKESKRKGKKPAQAEPAKPSTSTSSSGIKLATDGCKQIYTVTPIANVIYKATYCDAITVCWDASLEEHVILVPLSALDEEDANVEDIYVVRVKLVDRIPAGLLRPYVADMLNWVQRNGGQLPETAIKLSQIYNIVLKTVPLFRFVPIGRASFFNPPSDDGFDLGDGLVNWSGHSLIFNFGWKPFVNIDLVNSAFIRGRSVLEVLDELCFETFWNGETKREEKQRLQVGNKDVTPSNFATFRDDVLCRANNLLRTCKVKYRYGNSETFTKRVTEVVNIPPRQHTFTSGTGDTNVEEYCRTKQTRLQQPNAVCLKLGKNIVPAEICEVVKGQVFAQKLEEAQTAKMIKYTAKDPALRKQGIEQALRLNDNSNDPVLREFGVSVENQLLKIEKARVLPPPTLVYGSDQPNMQAHVIPGRDGVWGMNPTMRFYAPARKVKWSIIEVGKSLGENNLRKFVQSLIQSGRNAGLDLGDAGDVINSIGPARSDRDRQFKRNLYGDFEYFKSKNFKMIVVIIPRKDTNIYSAVKQTSELALKGGVLTQCVVWKNASTCSPSTIGNLILKINSKLGGVNYLMLENRGFDRIDILKAPVIIIGADVTHPAPGSKMPSMAAVTASIDRTGMPFMMHTQAQRKAEAGAAEIIEGLDNIMKKMLHTFIEKSGHKPRKIIFYRDGVGDSQFLEVLQHEMLQVRDACTAFTNIRGKNDPPGQQQPYEPKITFIAVQKRHKTRFFPEDPGKDGVGKPKNAPPGTVVDTQIVSANRRDFFLLSHLGIQGTSRPTHYQVLWDDSNFNMDELQILSYYLCYMYCRCTRSVSYPAPTYYAHLAATRAKIHTFGMNDKEMENVERVNEKITRQPQMIGEFPMHFV